MNVSDYITEYTEWAEVRREHCSVTVDSIDYSCSVYIRTELCQHIVYYPCLLYYTRLIAVILCLP